MIEEDDTNKRVCLSGTVDESVFRDTAGFGIILRPDSLWGTGLRLTRNLLYGEAVFGKAGCFNLLWLWGADEICVRESI